MDHSQEQVKILASRQKRDETDKAFMITFKGNRVWLPKSLCSYDPTYYKDGRIKGYIVTLPRWIFERSFRNCTEKDLIK